MDTTENQQPQKQAENQNPIFGITTETKTSNVAPIRVATQVENNAQFPSGWEFPIARLVNVVANPSFEKQDGSKVPVLDFIFVDADKRRYTHREWDIDTTDAKFQDKVGYMQTRIGHIYVETLGKVPQEGIGTGAKNITDFYNRVAQDFNKHTKNVGTEEQPKIVKAYSIPQLYIKLTYYKKNLGFPLSPNFLERVIKNQPCKVLTINPVYDKLEPETGSKGMPGMGSPMGGSASGDLPTFDDGFED